METLGRGELTDWENIADQLVDEHLPSFSKAVRATDGCASGGL